MLSHWVKNRTRKIGGWTASLLGVLLCMVVGVPTLFAQNEFTLTVTPPLYQLSLEPGEPWSSGISVVNSNLYDMTVFANIVDFEATGEEGRGSFKPLLNSEDGSVFGNWVTIESGPITVPKGQTKTIPFTVRVPDDASPGGHYAAILISNDPEENDVGGSSVNITSSVASLLFLQVAGDVVEKGLIREFSANTFLSQKPEVEFSLRFQNLGNVHVQPQGTVTIYNMWGKERGVVPINHKTDFGNVLPGSTRKFSFTWKGEGNAWDVGRYRAVTTLAYGKEARQSVTRETIFWVVPIMATLKVVGIVIIFLFIFIFSVRKYIQRALRLETERLTGAPVSPVMQAAQPSPRPSTPEPQPRPQPQPALEMKTLLRPLQQGAVDLRSVGRAPAPVQTVAAKQSTVPKRLSLFEFIRQYFLFFIFIAAVAGAIVFAGMYFESVLTYERPYEVIIEQGDGSNVTISSEDEESN